MAVFVGRFPCCQRRQVAAVSQRRRCSLQSAFADKYITDAFSIAGRQINLSGGQIKPCELKELSSSLRSAACTMKNRVKAKLGGLRQHFACFALRRIHRLSEAIGEEKKTLKRTLSEYLKASGTAFQLDCRILAYEYRDAAKVALMLYVKELPGQPAAPAGGIGDPRCFDNRITWKRFLDRDVVDIVFLGLVSPFTVFPTLLRLWMSILHGECNSNEIWGA